MVLISFRRWPESADGARSPSMTTLLPIWNRIPNCAKALSCRREQSPNLNSKCPTGHSSTTLLNRLRTRIWRRWRLSDDGRGIEMRGDHKESLVATLEEHLN